MTAAPSVWQAGCARHRVLALLMGVTLCSPGCASWTNATVVLFFAIADHIDLDA